MPLTQPASRERMHTRTIECTGYERDDGLWDIEGHLVDIKTEANSQRYGSRVRPAGQPIHDMWLRLTIDLDMTVRDAEAHMDASPHLGCDGITPNFKALIGLKIGIGWRREIAARLGGVHGCTHLVELLGPLGTTAYQATGRAREARNAGQPLTKRPHQINGCHMYSEDGPEVMKRWPQFYTGRPKAETEER